MDDNKQKTESLKKVIKNILEYGVNNAISADDTIESLIEKVNIYRELEYQNNELHDISNKLEISRKHFYNLFNYSPVSYLIFNENFEISQFNIAFMKLSGLNRDEILRQSFTKYIKKDDQDAFYFHIRDLKKSYEVQSV